MAKCYLCETHEAKYKYKLVDCKEVDICDLCGKVLWEYKINTKDRLLQLVEMLQLIKFKEEVIKMNRFNDEKYDTLSEGEKCETLGCECIKEWKYTFHKAGVRQTTELCSECVENEMDDVSKRYIDLEIYEKPKVFTMRRGR